MQIPRTSVFAAASIALAAAAATTQLTLAAPATAHETTARAVNGQIAFGTGTNHSQVYVINPDGTGEHQLTHTPPHTAATQPDWSPDATQIAYADNQAGSFDVKVMNADGTGKHLVVHRDGWDLSQPRWSPDGTKIVLTACSLTYPYCNLDVVNADGSNLHVLVDGHVFNGDPAWSPDGASIAFTSERAGIVAAVWVVDIWTGHLTRLTAPNLEGFYPSWSPSGTQIVLSDNADRMHIHTYLMNSDGSGLHQIAGDTGFASFSPNGQRILLLGRATTGRGNYLFTMSPQGGAMKPVVTDVPSVFFSDWGVHPRTATSRSIGEHR